LDKITVKKGLFDFVSFTLSACSLKQSTILL